MFGSVVSPLYSGVKLVKRVSLEAHKQTFFFFPLKQSFYYKWIFNYNKKKRKEIVLSLNSLSIPLSSTDSPFAQKRIDYTFTLSICLKLPFSSSSKRSSLKSFFFPLKNFLERGKFSAYSVSIFFVLVFFFLKCDVIMHLQCLMLGL